MIDYILYLLVGTYTMGMSEGIYVYRFNTLTGESGYVSMAETDNPSYLAIDEKAEFVYAVTENDGNPSYANAFSFDKETGRLTFLNRQETKGAAPCYISINEEAGFVATANYAGGSISVFPVNEDKTLGQLSRVFAFEGGGDNARQATPHLHCVQTSPDGKYLFAADLGSDKLHRFNISKEEAGQPVAYQSLTSFQVAKGAGPRHFVFHPDNRLVYLINEIGGTINSFKYEEGELTAYQTITADSIGAQGSADIGITPDGRFLYASNRLKGDGVAIFAISGEGTLTHIGYQPTGIHPRNFTITPNGKYLLVACRDSHVIQVFSINRETGLLTDLHKDIRLDSPVCLKFVKR